MKKKTLRKIDWAWKIFGAVLLMLFAFDIFWASRVGNDDKFVIVLFVLVFSIMILYIVITAIVLLLIWINKMRRKRK